MTQRNNGNCVCNVAVLCAVLLLGSYCIGQTQGHVPTSSDSSHDSLKNIYGDSISLELNISPVLLPLDWQPGLSADSAVPFSMPPEKAAEFLDQPYLPAPASELPGMDMGDIQNSTAYDMHYTDELRRAEQLKPDRSSNTPVVPILPMAYLGYLAARKGFLALKGTPPVQFDSTDAYILELVWDEPDLPAETYYERYNQTSAREELSFLILLARMQRLEKQHILRSRSGAYNSRHFSHLISRQQLIDRIHQELAAVKGKMLPARILSLETMKKLLTSSSHAIQ